MRAGQRQLLNHCIHVFMPVRNPQREPVGEHDQDRARDIRGRVSMPPTARSSAIGREPRQVSARRDR